MNWKPLEIAVALIWLFAAFFMFEAAHANGQSLEIREGRANIVLDNRNNTSTVITPRGSHVEIRIDPTKNNNKTQKIDDKAR